MICGIDHGGRMAGRKEISAEETAELQSLYAELPSAIAEWAEATRAEQAAKESLGVPTEGDEKVDTIIKRICQLSDDSEAK
jgi:hypothetical protein